MTDSSSSFQFGEAYNFSLGKDISLEEVVRKYQTFMEVRQK